MASVADNSTNSGIAPCNSTYMSSKASIEYARGKAAMSIGDFESALETVGHALKATLESIPMAVPDRELHESLGPLYYLYGTTLLYSIEESTSPTENDSQEEDTEEAAATADEAAQQEEEEVESNDEQEEEEEDAATTPNVITAMSNTAKSAEDIQIAWENLESARKILETLCDDTATNDGDADAVNTYKIDLAHVHLRLGDLSRGNGNYESAIEDYLSALRARTDIYGDYNRCVADCHYSLGMAYILLASEDSGNIVPTTDDDNINQDEGRKHEWRKLSVLHDLACGRALGGLIGKLCGVEAEDVVSKAVLNVGQDMEGSWWETKKISEDPSKDNSKVDTSSNSDPSAIDDTRARCSAALQQIQERVNDLKISQAQDNGSVVIDLIQMLDEIKGTVDASDESAEAVEELSKIESEKERNVIVDVMTKAMGNL